MIESGERSVIPTSGIDADLISRLVDGYAESVSVADLGREWDKGHDEVLRVLSAHDINLIVLPPWPGRRVRKADLEPVLAEWARLADLHERSVSLTEATNLLHISRAYVWELLSSEPPMLERDPETDSWGTVFITRDSIGKRLAARDLMARLPRATPTMPSPYEDWISYSEAAARVQPYGVGRAELRQLVASAVIAVRRSRSSGTVVSAASIDTWVASGAVVPDIPHGHPETTTVTRRRGVTPYKVAPYGQCLTSAGTLVADHHEQRVIREVRRMVAERTSTPRIAQRLNEAGFSDRYAMPWTDPKVRAIVRACALMESYLCEWPGCDRPVAPKVGPGTQARYCDMPEHSWQHAARLNRRSVASDG